MDPLTAAVSGLDIDTQQQHGTTTLPPLRMQTANDTDTAAVAASAASAGPGLKRSSSGTAGTDDSAADRLSPLSSEAAEAGEPRGSSSPAAAAAGPAASGDCSPSRSSCSTPQAAAATTGRGSSRALAIQSPPDPELAPDQLDQLLQQASPAIPDTRFSMQEFLKNKAVLGSAARRELGGVSCHPAAADDDVGSCLEGSGHAAELTRQASHLVSVIEGVEEESRVNRELAGLLGERLDSSRRALECLLRLLTCLMEAESAYSLAMAAAAKVASAGPLAAPSDSAALAAAVEGLVQLPAAAAAGHRQLYLELQLLVESVRGLWRQYTAAAKELKQSVQTVQRAIDSCCKQLQATLNEHRAACEAFDAAVVYHQAAAGSPAATGQQQQRTRASSSNGGGAGSSSSGEAPSYLNLTDAWTGAAGAAAAALSSAGAAAEGAAGVLRPRFAAAPSKDPWASEGRLVQEQQALQKWQDQERDLLQRGFESLQTLEHDRVAQLSQAGQALAAAYATALSGLPAAADELRGMLGGLGGGGEAGLAHLARVAAEMRMTSEQLAARQADAVMNVSQELFCSPEIIRQGAMELWNNKASSWAARHFVLTRAGFLHCFSSMDDVSPAAPALNLSRCEFEAGQAPVFHLVEASGSSWLVGRGSRKITLKAASIEECCEWAIALREAIALSSSTGAAAPGGSSSRHSLRGSR